MFGQTRWNPIDEVFSVHREVDRLFNQFWTDLPSRAAAGAPSFQVDATDEGWRVDVPMAGIDPQQVELEAAGTTLHIRTKDGQYRQALTVPPFLDLDRITASSRHGMLQLMLPLKDSVRPRKVQIALAADEQKQLSVVA